MSTFAPASTDFARATRDAPRAPQSPGPTAEATLWQEHGFALPGTTVLAIVGAIALLSLVLG